MNMCRYFFLILFSLGQPVSAQLYLIAGSTTPKDNIGYPTRLLTVEGDGSIRQEAELNTQSEGSRWIGISHDDRKAVVLVQGVNRTVVVDLNNAAAVKKCKWPPETGTSLINQWLVSLPSGLAFVEELAPPDIAKTYFTSMLLDASVPCDKSFAQVNALDMATVHISGLAGIAGTGSNEYLRVSIESDGKIGAYFPSGVVYLPARVPTDLLKGLNLAVNTLTWVDTKEMLVLDVAEINAPNVDRLLVLRKRDRVWWLPPVFNQRWAAIKGFGTFLTLAEAHSKDDVVRESVGREGWRKQDALTGPGMSRVFERDRRAYPGVLRVYDIERQRSYAIQTDQGDSEVLLINEGTIYYRVNDALYSATISDQGVETSHLLARGDVIRDVHWAFVKQ